MLTQIITPPRVSVKLLPQQKTIPKVNIIPSFYSITTPDSTKIKSPTNLTEFPTQTTVYNSESYGSSVVLYISDFTAQLLRVLSHRKFDINSSSIYVALWSSHDSEINTTLDLPFNENENNIQCIDVTLAQSPKFYVATTSPLPSTSQKHAEVEKSDQIIRQFLQDECEKLGIFNSADKHDKVNAKSLEDKLQCENKTSNHNKIQNNNNNSGTNKNKNDKSTKKGKTNSFDIDFDFDDFDSPKQSKGKDNKKNVTGKGVSTKNQTTHAEKSTFIASKLKIIDEIMSLTPNDSRIEQIIFLMHSNQMFPSIYIHQNISHLGLRLNTSDFQYYFYSIPSYKLQKMSSLLSQSVTTGTFSSKQKTRLQYTILQTPSTSNPTTSPFKLDIPVDTLTMDVDVGNTTTNDDIIPMTSARQQLQFSQYFQDLFPDVERGSYSIQHDSLFHLLTNIPQHSMNTFSIVPLYIPIANLSTSITASSSSLSPMLTSIPPSTSTSIPTPISVSAPASYSLAKCPTSNILSSVHGVGVGILEDLPIHTPMSEYKTKMEQYYAKSNVFLLFSRILLDTATTVEKVEYKPTQSLPNTLTDKILTHPEILHWCCVTKSSLNSHTTQVSLPQFQCSFQSINRINRVKQIHSILRGNTCNVTNNSINHNVTHATNVTHVTPQSIHNLYANTFQRLALEYNSYPTLQLYNIFQFQKNRNISSVRDTAKITTTTQDEQTIENIGCLLYGPSGCGKSALISQLAQSCSIPMITIRNQDIINREILLESSLTSNIAPNIRFASEFIPTHKVKAGKYAAVFSIFADIIEKYAIQQTTIPSMAVSSSSRNKIVITFENIHELFPVSSVFTNDDSLAYLALYDILSKKAHISTNTAINNGSDIQIIFIGITTTPSRVNRRIQFPIAHGGIFNYTIDLGYPSKDHLLYVLSSNILKMEPIIHRYISNQPIHESWMFLLVQLCLYRAMSMHIRKTDTLFQNLSCQYKDSHLSFQNMLERIYHATANLQGVHFLENCTQEQFLQISLKFQSVFDNIFRGVTPTYRIITALTRRIEMEILKREQHQHQQQINQPRMSIVDIILDTIQDFKISTSITSTTIEQRDLMDRQKEIYDMDNLDILISPMDTTEKSDFSVDTSSIPVSRKTYIQRVVGLSEAKQRLRELLPLKTDELLLFSSKDIKATESKSEDLLSTPSTTPTMSTISTSTTTSSHIELFLKTALSTTIQKRSFECSYILLHGPSACGKTLLARAAIAETKLPTFELSLAQLLKSGVGESEKYIRSLFSSARASAPSIIFIDDIHTLFPNTTLLQNSYDDDTGVSTTILAEFLTLLDTNMLLSRNNQTDENDGDVPPTITDENITTSTSKSTSTSHVQSQVYIIATAPHPKILHPAITTAGRIDKHIKISKPTNQERIMFIWNFLHMSRLVKLVSWKDISTTIIKEVVTQYKSSNLTKIQIDYIIRQNLSKIYRINSSLFCINQDKLDPAFDVRKFAKLMRGFTFSQMQHVLSDSVRETYLDNSIPPSVAHLENSSIVNSSLSNNKSSISISILLKHVKHVIDRLK